jgi:hypothetical protein
MKKQDVLDRRGEADNISAATVGRALAWLVKQGDVGEKQIMDQRGKPKVYWLAYKLLGGKDEGGSGYFNQTPSTYNENDRNKPEAETTPPEDAFMRREHGADGHGRGEGYKL